RRAPRVPRANSAAPGGTITPRSKSCLPRAEIARRRGDTSTPLAARSARNESGRPAWPGAPRMLERRAGLHPELETRHELEVRDVVAHSDASLGEELAAGSGRNLNPADHVPAEVGRG